MGYEQIQQFFTLPNLPDIITYILYGVALIVIAFVKAFVKRDNKNTLTLVNNKSDELLQAKKDLEQCREELARERELHNKEREEWRAEMITLKQAVRLSSRNTKDLVSTGVANKIAQMLPMEESDDNIEVEKVMEEENHESSN